MAWRPTRSPLRTAGLVLAVVLAGIGGPTSAQIQGTTPTDAGPAPHWRFLRHDPEGLKQLGGGDLTAGLNRLGEGGFELFIVTSANDQGGPGWFYLRQSPWIAPRERPKLEYRVLDDPQIVQLGQGDYADGLAALGKDGWHLVAITTTKGGGAGWSYFSRERPAAPPPTTSPTPEVGELPTQAAPAAVADFSTPRSAVQTLITAAAARDMELLSRCFADSAAEEFTPLRTRSASAKDLDDLAGLFQDAAITAERIEGDRTATVTVKLKTRNEEIDLVRTGAAWQVADF